MSPEIGATRIALDFLVTATFSEAINNSTLNDASFTLATTTGGEPVTGTVNVSGNTATFTPSAPLTANTQYTATITTAVKDASGNALPANFIWWFTTSVPTPPVLSLVASRTLGVAPLAVFFDATGTTSAMTIKPFHKIEYLWDFGDPLGSPVSGTAWNTGSRPDVSCTPGVSCRNSATGPVAAHVYETPGTYTVTLDAFDGTNTATTSVQITVEDPDQVFAGPNTICISNSSTFTGCPTPDPAQHVTTSDFTSAINDNIGTNKRLLFNRGDTFTAPGSGNIAVTGPGIVGAFGTGPAPVVNITGSNAAFKLSDRNTPTIRDWRIMDLQINGNSGPTSLGVDTDGGINQVTALRLNIHQVHFGFLFTPSLLDFWNDNGFREHTLWDQLAIVDCTINTIIGGNTGNGVYIGAQRFSYMGNVSIDTTGAEHVVRLPYLHRGVISNNTLGNPAPTKVVIKLHATLFGVNTTGFSEKIVLSDNKFTGGADAPWIVALSPQNAASNEPIRDVIVERNWFAPHPSTQLQLVVNAVDVTTRNNLFDLTGNLDQVGAQVFRRGAEPAPANVHFYNNTFYSGSDGNFVGIRFTTGTGHIARNNLGYAPFSTSRDMISGTATIANNTSDAGILLSPSFIALSPSVPGDFNLGPLSNALSQGAAVPVFSDFFRLSRPQNGGFDLGSTERP